MNFKQNIYTLNDCGSALELFSQIVELSNRASGTKISLELVAAWKYKNLFSLAVKVNVLSQYNTYISDFKHII